MAQADESSATATTPLLSPRQDSLHSPTLQSPTLQTPSSLPVSPPSPDAADATLPTLPWYSRLVHSITLYFQSDTLSYDAMTSSSDQQDNLIKKWSPLGLVMLGMILLSIPLVQLFPSDVIQDGLALDQGGTHTVQVSSYWYSRADIYYKESENVATRLYVYLYSQPPPINQLAHIYRHVVPSNRYQAAHFNLLSPSSLLLNWTVLPTVSLSIVILKSKEAYSLFEVWGEAPRDSILHSKVYPNNGSVSVSSREADDYYIIYSLVIPDQETVLHSSLDTVLPSTLESMLHIQIDTLTYATDPSKCIDSCLVSQSHPDCQLDIPTFIPSAFILFTTATATSSSSFMLANEAFMRISYHIKIRENIFTEYWLLWLILAVVLITMGFFTLLSIASICCYGASYVIKRCCPFVLDDEEEERDRLLRDAEAHYSGYGTYDFEPLPVYQPPSPLMTPPPSIDHIYTSPVTQTSIPGESPPPYNSFIQN